MQIQQNIQTHILKLYQFITANNHNYSQNFSDFNLTNNHKPIPNPKHNSALLSTGP